MDLADVLRAIFYLWLAVAIAYWAYRGYKRIVRGSADDLAERSDMEGGAGGATEGIAATGRGAKGAKGSRATKGANAGAGSATRPPGRRTMREVLDDQQAAKRKDPAVQTGDLVSSVIKEELAARKARDERDEPGTGAGSDEHQRAGGGDTRSTLTAGAAPGRRGLFAPTGGAGADDEADGDDEAPDAAPAAPAVSVLLEGIDMPCELVPLITTDLTPTPHRVVFVTTGHTAAQVGAAIGDELERLGFALRSESDTEVVATRGSDTLAVTLHPDAPAAQHDGAPLFPSVPGGSVAVEFRS